VLVALAALLLQRVVLVTTGLPGMALAGMSVDCLQGVSVGFNLLVALRLLLPAISQSGKNAACMAAAHWALGGALAGVVGRAGMVALCLGTPYCWTGQTAGGTM
jgi:hypothetical protein